MPADTTIHPFPELREYAESEARARVVAFAAIEGDACAPDGDVSTVAAVELRLLCDLTRPASRDAVARLVAARVGMPCGATAPGFYWMPGQPGSRDRDGAPEGDDWPPGWWLSNELGDLLFFTGADWCPDDHTEIAGLPDGNERAIEALTLIVRHLWPEEAPRG